jgi:class 3 adenylate cyclase/tetratricopeptide (TPR) repeat protein
MGACPGCATEVEEAANFCPHCGKRLQAPAGEELKEEELKVVTILFCDLVGSTEMAQTLGLTLHKRATIAFADIARSAVEDHGGQTGALHGDGIIAVFGIPLAHDYDALSAVTAARELQRELADLGMEEPYRQHNLTFRVRVAVHTGRVVVSEADALEERVTGHTVNVARRLQEAAEPDGILIGAETYQLVRDTVSASRVGPLTLKGVSEPVEAYQVLEANPEGRGRLPSLFRAKMIGRDLEFDLLRTLFERAEARRRCHLVTVLGRAGVGKTRLADEFSGEIGERARVLKGVCLPYGDSVTFFPMTQIIREAIGTESRDPKVVHELLSELLTGDDHDRDRQAVSQIEQLLGTGEHPATDLPGDTPAALRRLLESLAQREPVVVLIEDLHEAEPILLETLEVIAESTHDIPLLLVCMARPDELFERRRQWPGGRLNSTSLLLSPLTSQESKQLVRELLGSGQLDPRVSQHITDLSQGNPFILQELLVTLVDQGLLRELDGRWIMTSDLTKESAVPPKIEALLTARLDRLDNDERKVIDCAAVVGQRFHDTDIDALSRSMSLSQVRDCLRRLAHQELVQPDHRATPLLPTGGEGFAFRHNLIRNAVYERMMEPVRAELHESYATWLERAAGDRISQVEELIAHHLYQGYTYRRRLGESEASRRLAERAGKRYAALGQRAALRGDAKLTSQLLGRAAALLPADHPTRLQVLPDLAEAEQSRGDLRRAMHVYDDIVKTATAAGDPTTRHHAELGRLHVTAFQDSDTFLRHGSARIQALIPELERLDDRLGLGKAWYLSAYLDWAMDRNGAAMGKAERALGLVRSVRNKRWEAYAVRLRCLSMYWGPAHISEVQQYSKQALSLAQRSNLPDLEAGARTILARCAAMEEDFDKARDENRRAVNITINLGELLTQATDCITEGLIELLAGRLPAAEDALRKGYEALEQMGGTGPLATVAAMLGRVLWRQQNYEEAEEFARICERVASRRQADTQAKWRSVRAVVLARRGKGEEAEEAERLAREALEFAERTDQPDTLAEAHADLAEVLGMTGRQAEAFNQFKQALTNYERKGNLAAAAQIRSQMAPLSAYEVIETG